jgi:DNA-binding transcriptional LysR family regulator
MSVRDLGIRHFAALCAVVDEGTFAKAGAALGFSQSAISQQIGAIERAIGAPVFDRLGGARRVTLTPAGRILVDHAELVLRQLAEADDELERLAAGTEGTIVVGTFQSVSVKVLPEAIGRIRRQRPGVEIRLVENDEQNDLVEALRSGSLDVSFVVEPIRDDAIATIRLCDDPFVALCPIDDRAVQPHPGSRRDGRRDVLPVAALNGGALIGQPDQFCGQAVDRQLRSLGTDTQYVFRSADNGAVQAMVRAGMGRAVMPFLAINPDDPEVIVADLDPPLQPRRIALAYLAGTTLSPATRAFIAAAIDVADNLSHA